MCCKDSIADESVISLESHQSCHEPYTLLHHSIYTSHFPTLKIARVKPTAKSGHTSCSCLGACIVCAALPKALGCSPLQNVSLPRNTDAMSIVQNWCVPILKKPCNNITEMQTQLRCLFHEMQKLCSIQYQG